MSGQVVAIESERSGRRKPESLVRLRQAARKLFVERGYDATRPQDIAREAGLGHGTFYLHYSDKRACFLAFVEEARQDLDRHVQMRRQPGSSLEQCIASTLTAIYEYADNHPGMMRAAMTDGRVIDADGAAAQPLLIKWGAEWADMVRGHAHGNAEIIGQAIAGALHQASWECHRSGRSREELVRNITAFLTRALKAD
jgi:AcrR family transcriptional regulator